MKSLEKILYPYFSLMTKGVFILFFCFPSTSSAQIGAYYLPESAVPYFTDINTNNKEKNDIGAWVTSKGGVKITKDEIPISEYYAVYKIYTLELWFGCDSLDKQEVISDKLKEVKKKLAISDNLRKDIEIHLVHKSAILKGVPNLVKGGNYNQSSTEPIDSIKIDTAISKDNPSLTKGEEASLQKVAHSFNQVTFNPEEQRLLNNLRDTFSKKGKIKFDGEKIDYEASKLGEKDGKESAKSGNGKKGWFPVSVPVSRWFATTLEILMEVFLPGELSQVLQKAMTLAYMVAPDLVDNIASNLAKLQKALTPNKVDSALNKISKIAEVVYNLYKDFKEIHRMFSNGGFKKLLKNTSLTDAVDKINSHSKKYGLDLKSKLPKKMKEYLHYGDCLPLKGINDKSLDCLKGKVIDDISKEAVNTIPDIDKLGINPTDLYDLTNGNKSFAELGLEKGKELVCKSLPTRKYGDACEDMLNKNYKDAAIKIAQAEIGDIYGLNLEQINAFLRAIQNGAYREAIEVVGKEVLYKHSKNSCLTPYIKTIENIVSDKDESNNKDELEAIQGILCAIYGDKKAGEVINLGEDIYEGFAKMSTKNQMRKTQQLPDADSESLLNGQLPERAINRIIDNLDESTTNLIDENGKSIFKLEVDNLKKQQEITKKKLQSSEIIIGSPKFSDSQWILWKNKLPNTKGEDGYLELIYPEGFNKSAFDPSRRVYFINGILTPLANAKEGAKEIANRIKQPVCLVYSRSLKDKNAPGLTAINDLHEAIFIALNQHTPVSGLLLKQGIEIDLSSKKEVLVFAHSRGAAVTLNATNQLLSSRSSIEKSVKDYKKITIVTLGGYCPPKNEWSSEITIINHINKGDPVPILRGNKFSHNDAIQRILNSGDYISIKYHYLKAYYKYVDKYKR